MVEWSALISRRCTVLRMASRDGNNLSLLIVAQAVDASTCSSQTSCAWKQRRPIGLRGVFLLVRSSSELECGPRTACKVHLPIPDRRLAALRSALCFWPHAEHAFKK